MSLTFEILFLFARGCRLKRCEENVTHSERPVIVGESVPSSLDWTTYVPGGNNSYDGTTNTGGMVS